MTSIFTADGLARCGASEQVRYPLGPLMELTHCRTVGQLAKRVGVTRIAVLQKQNIGLTPETADRWAIACGWMPSEVWPNWR